MKRFNAILIVSVSIFPVFFTSALFSQGIIDSKDPKQEQAASKPGLNAATPTAPKDKIEIKGDAIEKSIPSYRMRLKDILKEAEENIKKVDKELKSQEVVARNREREAKVAEAFEKGNQLYKNGKLEEAKEEWKKALGISKDPEMRGYIEEAERKAVEEGRRIKEREGLKREDAKKERDRREAEAKEKAHVEREAARKAEAQAREKAVAEQDRREVKIKPAEKKAIEEVKLEEASESEWDPYSEAKKNIDAIKARLDQAEAREKARQEELAAREAKRQAMQGSQNNSAE
jgi:hypothetical protein